MNVRIIEVGAVYGQLKVIEELERPLKALGARYRPHRRFKMECVCGDVRSYCITGFTRGRTTSCGCVARERTRLARIKAKERVESGGMVDGICKIEEQYAAVGIDIKGYNKAPSMSVDKARPQTYPLYDIYKSIKNARGKKQRKALMRYAVEFYGSTCVVQFFERCERAA